MALRRAYFKCDNCGMELHLIAPVDRPCPACGGTFNEIDDDYEDMGNLDLGMQTLSVQNVKLSSKLVDKIIDDEMPEIIRGFEELLAEDAEKKGWG